MRTALHLFIAVFPFSTCLHTGWPTAGRRARLKYRAREGDGPSPWSELENGIRNSFRGLSWGAKTNDSEAALALEGGPRNIAALSQALSGNSSSAAAVASAVAAALPELLLPAVVPLGQRLLDAMMPRRQEGMPEECVRPSTH